MLRHGSWTWWMAGLKVETWSARHAIAHGKKTLRRMLAQKVTMEAPDTLGCILAAGAGEVGLKVALEGRIVTSSPCVLLLHQSTSSYVGVYTWA
jgi:hypothetical protein